MYADDLSCSVDSANEALEIYKQAKSIMLKGSFNLRKWNSNDKSVLNEILKMESKESASSKTDNEALNVKEDDSS